MLIGAPGCSQISFTSLWNRWSPLTCDYHSFARSPYFKLNFTFLSAHLTRLSSCFLHAFYFSLFFQAVRSVCSLPVYMLDFQVSLSISFPIVPPSPWKNVPTLLKRPHWNTNWRRYMPERLSRTTEQHCDFYRGNFIYPSEMDWYVKIGGQKGIWQTFVKENCEILIWKCKKCQKHCSPCCSVP